MAEELKPRVTDQDDGEHFCIDFDWFPADVGSDEEVLRCTWCGKRAGVKEITE